MSDITLTIGGRTYAVACDPGQEEHVASLGRAIDAKLAKIPGVTNQGEARTLLFASILLADELHEARAANASRAAAPAPSPEREAEAAALEALAERLEGIATRLESGPQSA